jgi:hypothetical protein
MKAYLEGNRNIIDETGFEERPGMVADGGGGESY